MSLVKSAFVAAGFGLLLIAASCANTGPNPVTDAGSDAPPIGPCGPGTAVKCGDTCVDTQSNSQNCGACGKACDSSLVCSHGVCTTVCASGTIHCGNDCIDQGADVNNCGGCGKKCPPGNVCSKGSCTLTCQDTLTNCNGDCVDITQNDDNCGACGSPCPGGQVCQDSKCVATCESPWVSCPVGDAGATTCVDEQNDPNNCNGCGVKCPSGQFCSQGQCGIVCLGGTSLCSGACVDESIDKNHCGNCTTTCSGICSAGHCCSTGQVYCGACDSITNCTIKTGGALTAGFSHTCAINSSGVLKCWGYGGSGELGNGNATSSKVPISPTLVGAPIFVGAGSSHTCAIVAGGKAFCWGYGFNGEIGDGLATEQDSPTAVANISNVLRIDGGGEHTCAIVNGGSVMCWGGNVYGDVGDGTGTERDTPVSTSPAIGTAVEINAGIGEHACAVLSTGGVQCWGEGDYGECGDNAMNFQNLSPVDVKTSSTTNLAGATHVVLGYTHSCAIVSNGDVYCWGDDTYGELGDGQTNAQSSVAIKATVVSGATALALGGDGFTYGHTCAIVAGGAVKCWGSNDFGQLGDGTTTSSTTAVTPISSGAIAIAAGSAHTCAMKSDFSVWCWGYNFDGQLGIGSTTDSHVPAQVTGF